MKVGVLFPSRFEDPGEFLADARAMEAAGVDSVWLEEASDGLDPMLALAAIAAVTSQLRLGLIRDGSPSPLWGGSGRGFDTLQQLSRQRVISRPQRWPRVDVSPDRAPWSRTPAAGTADPNSVIVPMH